jgi:tetratricopeptide (TPR) repeat protein
MGFLGKLFGWTAQDHAEARQKSQHEAEAAVNRGLQLRAEGKPAQAIAEFQLAVRLDPNDADARHKLGIALSEFGQERKAIAEYRQAIRIAPDVAQIRLNLANSLVNDGKLDKAVAEFREAIRLEPGNALAKATLAFELLMAKRSRRDDDEALALASASVALDSNPVMFAKILAWAQYRTGHWAEFLSAADRGIGLPYGGDGHVLFMRAVAHWHNGDKDAARGHFHEAARWMRQHFPDDAELCDLWLESADLLGEPGPNAADAALSRGVELSREGKPDEALTQFHEAVRLRPDDPCTYSAMADTYFISGKPDEAIAHATEAIRLDPNFAEAYCNRGWYHLEQEMYDEAFADFNKAIALDPTYALSYNNRGVAYAKRHDWDHAIADYAEVLKLNPDHPWARNNLVTSYVNRAEASQKQGDFESALVDYDRALGLDPDAASAYYHRGIGYVDQGRYDEAIADFTRVMAIETNWPVLFERGRAYWASGRFAEAIADVTAALDFHPDNLHVLREAWIIRAKAYQGLNDHARAVADLTQVLRIPSIDSQPFILRGTSFAALDKHDEAIADFTKALQMEATPAAYLGRAQEHAKQRRHSQSLHDLTEAIELQPEDPTAYQLRAETYRSLGDLGKASRDDQKFEAATTLGQVAERLQNADWDRAISLATEVIRLDPSQPKGYVRRGVAYLSKNEPAQALADFNHALDELPSLPSTVRALVEQKRAQALAALGERTPSANVKPASTHPTSPIEVEFPARDEVPLLDADGEAPPPSPRRVADRAMVLSAIVCRALLEQEHLAGNREHAEGRTALLSWIDALGLRSELESEELAFLQTPIGRASPRQRIDGDWRREGLSVLAWALGRFPLPAYDRLTDAEAVLPSVDFLSVHDALALRESARLRPADEIGRFASHITIVHWRLRTFQLDPELVAPSLTYDVSPEGAVPQDANPVLRKLGDARTGIGTGMDFAQYLRAHPRFQEHWLDHLRLIDGDLAIGDQSLADAFPRTVEHTRSCAVERQIAAYWLNGADVTYSNVQANTMLSGC